jgi:hypothetical protein
VEEGVMRWLLTIGVLLTVIGGGGGIAACFGTATFDRPEDSTIAAQLDDPTDSLANHSDDETPRLWLAPVAGLTFATGLVCVAIGMGNWRRALQSETRPANPWSDRPGQHGGPPRGLP